MGKQMKRPGDITGRKAAMLAEQSKEELKARAEELTMFNAAAEEERKEVVSLVSEPAIESQGQVQVEVPVKTFRVNSTLENMTFGHGNTYSFEEGRTYKAPKALYDHLEEKGYIWH